jgi:hypothetical protein
MPIHMNSCEKHMIKLQVQIHWPRKVSFKSYNPSLYEEPFK